MRPTEPTVPLDANGDKWGGILVADGRGNEEQGFCSQKMGAL